MRKLFSLLVTTMVTTALMAQWQPQGKRIKTQWADKVSPANVLPEYPRPIMERADWMNLNGESVYDTQATDLPVADWGVTTQKDGRLFLHVFDNNCSKLTVPWTGDKPKTVRALASTESLHFTFNKRAATVTIQLPDSRDAHDFVVEISNEVEKMVVPKATKAKSRSSKSRKRRRR